MSTGYRVEAGSCRCRMQGAGYRLQVARYIEGRANILQVAASTPGEALHPVMGVVVVLGVVQTVPGHVATRWEKEEVVEGEEVKGKETR